MTNSMIILLESVKLMESGQIGGSGVKGLTPGGKEIELPEPIHTYQYWKSIGYQVKKGSKAIAQFPIWKYTSKKTENMTEEEAQEAGNSYCFMKLSSFFKRDQVEPIKNFDIEQLQM